MRHQDCKECGASVPMREAYSSEGRELCRSCAEQFLKEHPSTRKDEMWLCSDPTVCGQCGRDNGENEYEKLAGVPLCPACREFYVNRPFPIWIKFAAAGLIVLVIIASIWNARFAFAYINLKKMYPALAEGNIAEAVRLSSSAAEMVPESGDLKSIADYCEGIALLSENRASEALAKFKACGSMPSEYGVPSLISQAEIGVAFDGKDYDRFLELALQQQKSAPDSPMLTATVASAYACKYATTGSFEFRDKAKEFLEKAKALGGSGETLGDYEMRILHRIHTREIINSEEFRAKYPDGWKVPGGEV